MAKLQHTFIQGKMNKDLDERLVPNGQYRDAQNIQVSTSEGSDVGAVENILGNTKKNLRSTGPDVFWPANFGLRQTPACIGVAKDSQNEKIYWFLATDPSGAAPTSAIVEYDQTTGIVAPVLVDINGVLNFDRLNLITGVNILEGLLYWTDNLNEPRVINIATFKAGSTDFVTQTRVYGTTRDFIASDITVIKKAPGSPLTAEAFPSLYSGVGTGITPVNPVSFSLPMDAIGIGTTVGVSWVGNPISWTGLIDPSVVITVDLENEDGSIDSYQITGTLSNINTISALLTVQSASAEIPNSTTGWSMLLIEDDPIFKNDFPRFSYRYKFTDNRFSPYAPFSNAVFVPGEFKYLSRDGNNAGMEDTIRKITLTNFPNNDLDFPKDVKEIQVLYKGSVSNNIYVIESFGYDPLSPVQPVISLDITSGVLGPVIESSQLLRLYDNVPKKAKAQEVVGNRIIYGNYLHNYDVVENSISVSAAYTASAHANLGFGLPSVKTNREFQVGVTFIDESGRESPVFTSNSGSITVESADSVNTNAILASVNSIPSWASYYKYYIKNSTPEYYNLALDRYYDAIDGSVWLSFPSSERNKLSEGRYMYLKKQHDSSKAISVNNKYKILDISNEAPSFLTNVPEPLARYNGLTNLVGDFTVGNKQVTFLGPTNADDPVFFSGFKRDNTVQFILASGASSFEYEIYSGGPTAVVVNVNSVDYNVYEVYLKQPLREDDAWLALIPQQQDITIAVSEIVTKNLPELQGRFFAKVSPNATFYDSIPKAFASTGADYLLDFYSNVNAAGEENPFPPELDWFDQYNDNSYGATAPGVGLENGTDFFNLFYSGTPFGFSQYSNSVEAKTWAALQKPGTRIKFVQSNGSISDDFYVVLKVENGVGTYGQVSTYDRDQSFPFGQQGSNGFFGKFTLNRPYTDTGDVNAAGIQVYRERIKTSTTLLSSSNPAIFETEPYELVDLDIYFEASEAIDKTVTGPGVNTTLDWFNCYSFGNGVESDRIRDDFNAPTIGKGVRASSTIEEPYREERRATGLIFSGIFNSISGVNNTNQFLIAESITKDLNPTYGSIQKLHARDTDLIALLEDKCFKILANKDALFNADGNTNVTSNANVLGQTIPFVGEYGISKNPESFASFGFRAYFTDKARGAVMRLSRDGLTDISDKGMSYFFQDGLKTNVNPNIIGAYDSDAGSYNVVVGGEGVSFKEKSDGWNTRLSYDPEAGISLNNEYYTFKNGELYEHSNATRSNFYGVQEDTTVTPIFNDAPTSVKNFKTLSYEGDEGWIASVTTNKQSGTVSTWKEREGIYFNYIMGDATTLGNIDTKEFSVQGIGNVFWHDAGSTIIVVNGEINVSLQPGDIIYSTDPTTLRTIGTVLVVDRVNNSIRLTSTIPGAPPVNGDFLLFGKDSQVNTSGLLGYYGEAVFSTSSSDKKELFAVNSEVFISSE
jgi:hypothetical protein